MNDLEVVGQFNCFMLFFQLCASIPKILMVVSLSHLVQTGKGRYVKEVTLIIILYP